MNSLILKVQYTDFWIFGSWCLSWNSNIWLSHSRYLEFRSKDIFVFVSEQESLWEINALKWKPSRKIPCSCSHMFSNVRLLQFLLIRFLLNFQFYLSTMLSQLGKEAHVKQQIRKELQGNLFHFNWFNCFSRKKEEWSYRFPPFILPICCGTSECQVCSQFNP